MRYIFGIKFNVLIFFLVAAWYMIPIKASIQSRCTFSRRSTPCTNSFYNFKSSKPNVSVSPFRLLLLGPPKSMTMSTTKGHRRCHKNQASMTMFSSSKPSFQSEDKEFSTCLKASNKPAGVTNPGPSQVTS